MNGEKNAIRVYEQHNVKDVTVLLVSSTCEKHQKRRCALQPHPCQVLTTITLGIHHIALIRTNVLIP